MDNSSSSSNQKPDKITSELNSGYSIQVLIDIVEKFNHGVINELYKLKELNCKIDEELLNCRKNIMRLERLLLEEKQKLLEEKEKLAELNSGKNTLIEKFKLLGQKAEELDRKYTKLQTENMELTLKYKVRESELAHDKQALKVAVAEYNKYKAMVIDLEEENLDLKRQIITLTKPDIIIESIRMDYPTWKNIKDTVSTRLKTPIKLGLKSYIINRDLTICRKDSEIPFGTLKYNYDQEILEIHQINI